MFDEKYNDNYRTPTEKLFGDDWTIVEPDHSILRNRRTE